MADSEDETTEGAITINEVKGEITPQDYETLTLGDDTVAVRCLLKAKIAVKGMVLSTGHEYDELNEVCRAATLKRTLYELYAYCGQEQKAREKEEDCELLIETYFGSILKKTDTKDGSGPAFGAMSNRRKNPLDRSSAWV